MSPLSRERHMTNLLVLEQWQKSEYWNRLVTDGRRVWLEYQPKYQNDYSVKWVEDPTNREFWLIDFNGT